MTPPALCLLDGPSGLAAPLAAALADALERPLGFRPAASASIEPADETYILPCKLEFGLFDREALSQRLAEARRAHPQARFFHDDVDLGHPLLVQAFAEKAMEALAAWGAPRERVGLLAVGQGEGDPSSRAQVYRWMRLLWEQLGVARGEVAFLRNPMPFLRAELEQLPPLSWVVIPLLWEPGERLEHLRTIVEDHVRHKPEVAGMFRVAEPPGAHPALVGWLAQRALDLWRSRRQAEAGRAPSPKRAVLSTPRRLGSPATGLVGDCRNADELRALLPEELLDAPLVFVKPTWHGYAAGTYTDPAALDALLTALPGKVVLLEGHTSSRHAAPDAGFDWETEARAHRAWIAAQEQEYLRKTGLTDVLVQHKAQYVNVTEAYWDADEPDAESFIPPIVREHVGAPLLSCARFKGPTRLSLSNLFGLLPDPLRSRWHGPNITYFARVCCGVARRWDAVTPLYGLVEGLSAAVKWDRRGLYRSRWGNYDLIPQPGVATLSRGVAGADVLAARLQGQSVGRSGFFDVVRAEFEIPDIAEEMELPLDWIRRFA
ncbi:MAG: hypothetical protein GC160_18740 [Acidobacteria bacterium]|nr:hypothetical protein [Acidobacteriota bacterium]